MQQQQKNQKPKQQTKASNSNGAHREDFIGGIELVELEGRGRGFRAVRDLPPGTLVMKNHAVALSYAHDTPSSQVCNVDLIVRTLQALDKQPKRWPAVLAMANSQDKATDESLEKRIKLVQEQLETDEISITASPERIAQLASILPINAFGTQNADAAPFQERIGHGLFVEPALFNHSCWPNTTRLVVGNIMYLRTTRFVPKGEELCVTYLDLLARRQARQETLQRDYHFECKCVRCTDPAFLARDQQLGPSLDDGTQQLFLSIKQKCESGDLELAVHELNANFPAVSHSHGALSAAMYQMFLFGANIAASVNDRTAAQHYWGLASGVATNYLPPNSPGVLSHTFRLVLAWQDADVFRAASHLVSACRVHNTCFGGGWGHFSVRYDLHRIVRPEVLTQAKATFEPSTQQSSTDESTEDESAESAATDTAASADSVANSETTPPPPTTQPVFVPAAVAPLPPPPPPGLPMPPMMHPPPPAHFMGSFMPPPGIAYFPHPPPPGMVLMSGPPPPNMFFVPSSSPPSDDASSTQTTPSSSSSASSQSGDSDSPSLGEDEAEISEESARLAQIVADFRAQVMLKATPRTSPRPLDDNDEIETLSLSPTLSTQ